MSDLVEVVGAGSASIDSQTPAVPNATQTTFTITKTSDPNLVMRFVMPYTVTFDEPVVIAEEIAGCNTYTASDGSGVIGNSTVCGCPE